MSKITNALSFTISFNPHKNYYQPAKEYLEEMDMWDVKDNITEDTLWEAHVYWNTPVGFTHYIANSYEQLMKDIENVDNE